MMTPRYVISTALLTLLASSVVMCQSAKKNVLMIIVDDFRPEIRRYAGSDSALNPSIRTPNIDALADTGVTFTNAHTVVSTAHIVVSTAHTVVSTASTVMIIAHIAISTAIL